jgi:NADH ubiquinone oxidoreductase subunit NDUFA12.
VATVADDSTGDTKYGELVGVDKFGNKFYENKEELPRTAYPGQPNSILRC